MTRSYQACPSDAATRSPTWHGSLATVATAYQNRLHITIGESMKGGKPWSAALIYKKLWFALKAECNAVGWNNECTCFIFDMSYGQNGEGTSLSRVVPYRFCSGDTLDKPSSGYRVGYRFRVGSYRFCSDGNPTTLSILLWSYLVLSDTHICRNDSILNKSKQFHKLFFHILGFRVFATKGHSCQHASML